MIEDPGAGIAVGRCLPGHPGPDPQNGSTDSPSLEVAGGISPQDLPVEAGMGKGQIAFCHALDETEVSLLNALVRGRRRQPPSAGDDLRGLRRPSQRTGADPREAVASQRLRKLERLPATVIVQGHIDPSLQDPRDVPIGLAVPGHAESGGAARIAPLGQHGRCVNMVAASTWSLRQHHSVVCEPRTGVPARFPYKATRGRSQRSVGPVAGRDHRNRAAGRLRGLAMRLAGRIDGVDPLVRDEDTAAEQTLRSEPPLL
jgi:hypothetical protein